MHGALPREFYIDDPAEVARRLLGKVVVRKLGSTLLSGRIVETEAYYGYKDPASRAFKGRKVYNSSMFEEQGRLFIYMVHSYWLLNIVAHPEGKVGAVLLRALEPLEGIPAMKVNRGVEEVRDLMRGPGRLTRALNVINDLNGLDITDVKCPLVIIDNGSDVEKIGESHRIGVTSDLPLKLRFYVEGSRFVSR
ncbi:MAG TPA: DNA-3-methyladenine glycosylase [Patescibacteria group bacterium]|nr:DNA-3-methyladenine glycosylase [Patescibacteria group bacterium]